jgi:hypothetical protein
MIPGLIFAAVIELDQWCQTVDAGPIGWTDAELIITFPTLAARLTAGDMAACVRLCQPVPVSSAAGHPYPAEAAAAGTLAV